MSVQRKYVASIAGFDPTAGAGILADLKCFEQHQVYGFGICTALTVQTDNNFISVEWQSANQIISQLAPLLEKFETTAIKIGLIKELSILEEVVAFIKLNNSDIALILDPILSSSSGFGFHNWNTTELTRILTQLTLITPNYEEMKSMGNRKSVEKAASGWAAYCPVLLKGGHHPLLPGRDLLFETPDKVHVLDPIPENIFPKHGSGCILSAAITANIAHGYSLNEACHRAKNYITNFLNSNTSLLGYHHH
ncbi:hydroxymethylpyrimidine/phosphomethylpyrimidine kinase [Pedobacter insulae]|uniref:hydroxymethylpyrimidine kinase n=1 Tax=Pedobacter insulae TaxID=414048 RepID=A0A1I3A128_9SPHI|nr:hydroxymethylpyrimidine/phosphomethylpyrimidine kinase [Pedobacter insulae]SFH43600.1 hydroxymethylpyrimidine/phosphomethylpyrimidine kinase [Pedobacter insulae]